MVGDCCSRFQLEKVVDVFVSFIGKDDLLAICADGVLDLAIVLGTVKDDQKLKPFS